MNGLGKAFRKKSDPKNRKYSKKQSKIAACEQKTTSEKANYCSNTVFSLYFKFRAKKFHAAKPLAFSLHFLFQRDENHYSNLTSKIMKMCEQILKKRQRPNTLQIFWIVKKNQEKANNSPSYRCAAIKKIQTRCQNAACEQKTTSEKEKFGSNTVFSLYFKIRAENFHTAKKLAFSLQFLFRRDQNHYSNLTSKIMKMCEQILKKRQRPNTIQILWIVKNQEHRNIAPLSLQLRSYKHFAIQNFLLIFNLVLLFKTSIFIYKHIPSSCCKCRRRPKYYKIFKKFVKRQSTNTIRFSDCKKNNVPNNSRYRFAAIEKYVNFN